MSSLYKNTLWIPLAFIIAYCIVPFNISYASLNIDYVEVTVTYKKSFGEVCDQGSDCLSDHCVDGYCCDSSCTGTCESCSLSGTEGFCTTRSIGDNTECSACNFCNGSAVSCQVVSEYTDPYDDCASSCVSGCEDYTGFCDGAGACASVYCSVGTACSANSCSAVNYCNSDYALGSCEGDDCYDTGATLYSCQAQCDAGGSCDYASNCTFVGEKTSTLVTGNISFNNLTLSSSGEGPVSELVLYGGQVYETVKIGDQLWLAENLNITNGNTDKSCSITRYCYDDISSNCTTYGGLYTWTDMMCGENTSSSNPSGVQGICPDGWHLPSDDEVEELEGAVDSTYSYGDSEWDTVGVRGTDAGAALSGNYVLWEVWGGTIQDHARFGVSGFDNLPSGYRHQTGTYLNLGYGRIWTATQLDASNAYLRQTSKSAFTISRVSDDKDAAKSVRCLKD